MLGNIDLDQLKEKENPIPLLKIYFSNNPNIKDTKDDITKLYQTHNWNKNILLKILFGSLFGDDIQNNFLIKVKYLKQFIESPKDYEIIIDCINKSCKIKPENIKIINDILYGFWYVDILDDNSILNWYNSSSLDLEIKKTSEPFINWLKNLTN